MPPQCKEVIARLDLHGLTYTRIKHPLTTPFATYRFEKITYNKRASKYPWQI